MQCHSAECHWFWVFIDLSIKTVFCKPTGRALPSTEQVPRQHYLLVYGNWKGVGRVWPLGLLTLSFLASTLQKYAFYANAYKSTTILCVVHCDGLPLELHPNAEVQ